MPLAQVPNLVPALPELFLAVIIMVLLMFGVFQKAEGSEGEVKTARMTSGLAVFSMLVAMFILITNVGTHRMTIFGDMFITDAFAIFCKTLVLVGAATTLIIAQGFLVRHEMARFEYPVLIIFATLGMMMMLSANDLISLYIGLEMQSLSLYVIAAFRRDDSRSSEAGLKYFVLGALASGMLLYGSSLVYGFAGTTNFGDLAELFKNSGGEAPGIGVIFGIVFILAGLAFKVSAVPFHMWTPDVYEGAPTPVTAFFAIAPKIAALGLFIRVMVGPFGDLIAQWQQIVVFVSIASMLLGSFAAINQTNIKRLMAYSSIGHVGYALIGLAVGNEAGVKGVLVYLSIYLVMNVGAFSCILCMRRGDRMVENISDLAGLGKSHKLMAAALAVFMFSLAGIPPLAGFFGKLVVFMAAVDAGLYGLAVIGVLASVVGAFYYLRIVKAVYFDNLDESLDKPVEKELGVVIGIASVLIIFFFVFPSPIMDTATTAAASLFTGR